MSSAARDKLVADQVYLGMISIQCNQFRGRQASREAEGDYSAGRSSRQ
jgi:hypothetical protein